jgi:hypothetical protein
MGPCHHGMARPQVADRKNGLQIWRLAANILNKQSRTADNWSSSLGVGRGGNKVSSFVVCNKTTTIKELFFCIATY